MTTASIDQCQQLQRTDLLRLGLQHLPRAQHLGFDQPAFAVQRMRLARAAGDFAPLP